MKNVPNRATAEGLPAAVSRRAFLRSTAGMGAASVAGVSIMQVSFAMAEPCDPMLTAVMAHEDAVRRQDNAANLGDNATADALGSEVVAIWNKILTERPAIMTTAGALAAIRFVRDDVDWHDEDHKAVLSAALAFLEQQTSL